MIKDFIFKDKLIDIETSEVESRLKKFWLKLSDDNDSLAEGFHEYSDMDQVYRCAEESLKKRFKRQRLSTSEKLQIYKQIANLKNHSYQFAFDYNIYETIIREIVKKTEKLHMYRTSMSQTTKWMLITSILIKKKIASFLDANNKPIISKEVWFFVIKETEIRILIHICEIA